MAGREALLDAAFETLVADGPAFGVERVARAAGASKALVFHHFGTREGLLDAMAARVLAQTQEGLARLAADFPEPRERMLAFARTLLEEPLGTSPREARHVMQFWLLDDASGACRGALRDELLRDFVRATLRERPGRADADALSTLLLARWHGVTALYASGTAAIDFDRESARLAGDAQRLLLGA